MSESFGVVAARLSGAAAMLLGWRPEEFWRATPAELGSAIEQYRPESEAPDASTVAELRKRFPDD